MATSYHLDRAADDDEQRETNACCPECGGSIRSNAGETICESCGLVLEEQRIDNGPEWRTFGETETNPERTGAPLTPSRHDRGLSTVIGRGTDGNGNTISGRKRRQLSRMRREQSRGRWRSKAERNLAHGLSETQRVASALDLPRTIRDQACQLFRSAANEDLLPGRSIEAVLLGWRGRSRREDFVFGSNVDEIITKARCDVIVERIGPRPETVEDILLPTAGGPHAEFAAEVARSIARANDARIHVVNVVDPDASEHERSVAGERVEAVAALFDETDRVEQSVVEGLSVVDTIVDMTDEYDLTLIGATREGLFQQLLSGSSRSRSVSGPRTPSSWLSAISASLRKLDGGSSNGMGSSGGTARGPSGARRGSQPDRSPVEGLERPRPEAVHPMVVQSVSFVALFPGIRRFVFSQPEWAVRSSISVPHHEQRRGRC